MFAHRFLLAVTVFVVTAASVLESQAQQTGNTGSSGTTRSTGNTGSTGSSANSRTTGGGGSTSGTYVQEFSFDSAGGTSTGNSSNNFIGSSDGSSFIGGSGGTTSSRTTAGRTSTMSTTNRNRATTANRTTGQTGGGNRVNSSTQVQPVITLGFTAPARNFAGISTALSQRVTRVEQTGRLGMVQLELADGIFAVSGTVASEHDRRVAENMIRLQPGVSEINSDIQIETSAAPQNMFSPSVRRNQQTINVDDAITPQGRPLVYVF